MLIAVVIVFFVLIISAAVYVSRRARKTSDFLIAGRKVNLAMTTATLAVMQIGAGIIMGGSKEAADFGIWPGLWYGIGCGGGLILAGLLAASKLRKSGGFVPLDFFSTRYGEKRWVRIWGWMSNVPSLFGIFVVQIMAARYILPVFGIDSEKSAVIAIIPVGIVTIIYSTLSGMWGIVVVDLIQMAVILIGIPIVTAISFIKLQNVASLQSVLLTPFIPHGSFSRAVFLILPFLLSISVSYDAFMRFQAAKSARTAKLGAVFSGLIVIAVSFCICFVGAAGRKIFPDIQSSLILPHMIKTSLHPALAGLVVSAILASIMSSAACLALSLAGTCSRDFYNKVLYPGSTLDDLKYSKLISRITIVAALVIGFIVAFKAVGILDTMIIFNYPYMGSMLVPLLGGLLWKRATFKAAKAAIIVGGLIGVLAFLISFVPQQFIETLPQFLKKILNVDLGLLIAYAVSAVVFISVSLATQPPSQDS